MNLMGRVLGIRAKAISTALVVLAGLLSAHELSAQGLIDHTQGFAGAADLTLNGGASISGSNLRITDGANGEARSAFFTTAVPIGSFQTRFTFHILKGSTGAGTGLADGIGFCIQGNANTALGAGGGQMGYQGIAKSVFVKFDPYGGGGAYSSTFLYENGADPAVTTGETDTTATFSFQSGDDFECFMNYDGTTLTVTITDLVSKKSLTQMYTVNIAADVGAATGFIGFTGGTGGLNAIQEVMTFAYSTQPMPITVTTTPGPDSVTLNWTAPAGAPTSYLVFRSNTSGGPYTLLTTINGAPPATTYFDNVGVTFPNTYYYVVVASNGTVTSIYSDEVPGTPTQPQIVVSPAALTVAENGGMAVFNVSLLTPPTATVTVTLSSANPGALSISTGTLTFNVGGVTTLPVTVTGVQQGLEGANVIVNVNFTAVTSADTNYPPTYVPPPVVVTIIEDLPAIIANPGSIATVNGGLAVQFTVQLATTPKGTVNLDLSVSDPNLATVSPLTIPNAAYNTPVTVTVTPLNANPQTTYIGPYDIIVSVDPSSTDPAYLGVSTLVPVSTPVSIPPLDHVWKCGLLGAEGILALGLLAVWRRRRQG